MTWTHIPKPRHTRCFKPIFGLMNPHGSIWACDTCGKRWRVDKAPDPATGERSGRWVEVSVTGARIASDYLDRLGKSKEPVDVGRRELGQARIWLDRHIDAVYADLGLERAK